MIPVNDLCEHFAEQGYITPIPVFTELERARVIQLSQKRPVPRPLDWIKGYAATSRTFYELGTHPAILKVVRALLGENILLWGASFQTRAPNEIHYWHTDIESAAANRRTVAVWIGIENSNTDSCLTIIPYSHQWNVTLQQERARFGKKREETTSEDALEWARKFDERACLLKPEVKDGEALFFDGRIWHYSQNLLKKTRQALLFQYASTDVAVRIPVPNHLDWPFRFLTKPMPSCLVVQGEDKHGVNRIVSPPTEEADPGKPALPDCIRTIDVPLPPDPVTGWKPYPLFDGPTVSARNLSCHVSVLNQGRMPHPPHIHDEEEILFVLRGEVDVILPHLKSFGRKRKRLRSGDFVYYPAGFAHTLRAISSDPANYLMLKWKGDPVASESRVPFGQFCYSKRNGETTHNGFHCSELFSGPTSCLAKLQCHQSTMHPGEGYEPHVDSYDVVILVVEGELETLNRKVGPNTVVFYPAGERHGLRNSGNTTARYVVFEFHPAAGPIPSQSQKNPPSLLSKLKDPTRWKRRLKKAGRRLLRSSN